MTYLGRRRKEASSTKIFFMREPVFLAAAFIGVLTGLSDYFYAYAEVPLYSINAVALLAVGAGVLALHASSDRPKGEPNKEYYMGVFMTVTAAVLYGFILPLVELTYRNYLYPGVGDSVGYVRFPKRLEILNWAKTTYYVVLVCFGIICQCFFLGAIGVVFSASSLFSAIITAVLLPVIEILAVIFYSEKFQADKGVSLVLSCGDLLPTSMVRSIKHSDEKSTETQILEMCTPPNDS
ncbi:hypothetical protein C3L33_09219, partial [Rhododendron williamsianum]